MEAVAAHHGHAQGEVGRQVVGDMEFDLVLAFFQAHGFVFVDGFALVGEQGRGRILAEHNRDHGGFAHAELLALGDDPHAVGVVVS